MSEELAESGELADPPRRGWPATWPAAAKNAADLLLTGLWRVRQNAEDDSAATAAALGEAITELAKHGGPALPLQAAMIRELLERAYPDGFTGKVVQEVLMRCVGAASELMDDEGLIEDLALVVGGALGMSEEFGESAGPRAAARFLRSGLLVLDDLLSRTGLDAGVAVETAIGEIWRSETMEMP
ncbi:hypothetical protein [Tomitella biformata]|uniref:hypothetical protein n=1 Tax=Tomitella biformata TaxID=630403 RepID=UPI0011DD6B9C|nr:hypothetical protein [Tomitella biformata]